jgi:predicted ATPase
MADQVFVGREQGLAHLGQLLDRSLDNQGQVCFVTGEAGSGKTDLVTEFARRAHERYSDLVVAVGQCDAHTGIGDPFAEGSMRGFRRDEPLSLRVLRRPRTRVHLQQRHGQPVSDG